MTIKTITNYKAVPLQQHDAARALAAEVAAASASAREAAKESEIIQAKDNSRRLQERLCRTEQEVERLRAVLEVII